MVPHNAQGTPTVRLHVSSRVGLSLFVAVLVALIPLGLGAQTSLIRINCGGPAVTIDGDLWLADMHFSGGSTAANPTPILGTTADPIYQSERWGQSTYEIPIANASNLIVHLHFAEIYFGAPGGGPPGVGNRVFDVAVEGTPLLNNYDLFADVGPATAVVHIASPVTVVDGSLTIELTTITDNAKISAIEVLLPDGTPMPPTPSVMITSPESGETVTPPFDVQYTVVDHVGLAELSIDDAPEATQPGGAPFTILDLAAGLHVLKVALLDAGGVPTGVFDQVTINVEAAPPPPPPGGDEVRINCGGPEVTTGGLTWSADNFFSGGSVFGNNVEISGTTNDVLYQTERYGSLQYNVPVSNGTYDIVLHFAELFWGVAPGFPGGPGFRVCDITVEDGQGNLLEFDLGAAVAPGTAYVHVFEDVVVTDGAATISLVNIIDNGKLSAIEVLGDGTAPPPPPATPTITITGPVDGSMPVPPFFVNLTVTDWPIGPGAEHVQLFIDGMFHGSHYALTPISIASLAAGPHTIHAELANADGSLTGIFDTINITVPAAPPATPTITITAPIDGGMPTPPFDVTFTVTDWPIGPGAEHIQLFIDGAFQGAFFDLNPVSIAALAPGLHTVHAELANTNGSLTGYFDSVMITVPAAPPGPTTALRINCGGPALMNGPDQWIADDYFTGGNTAGNSTSILNTTFDALYQTERYGNCVYQIPVDPGVFEVVCHFAEIYFGAPGGGPSGAGNRIFDMSVEGQPALTNYDLFASVGPTTAVTHTFPNVTCTDGALTIVMSTDVDNAKISGIEVIGVGVAPPDPPTPVDPRIVIDDPTGKPLVDPPFDVAFTKQGWPYPVQLSIDGVATATTAGPGPFTISSLGVGPHTLRLTLLDAGGQPTTYIDQVSVLVGPAPVAPGTDICINCGGPQVSAGGKTWIADTFFSGGSAATNPVPITGTTADAIYQSERWGNSFYSIPVAPGTYDVTLHFAEIYFGAPGGGPAGAAKRVFDVNVEGGQGFLNDVDLFSLAGPTTAYVQTFPSISVVDGFLTIQLLTVIDNAKISAIQVEGMGGGIAPPPPPAILPLGNWVAHEIDSLPYRVGFVDGCDINGDGLRDIVAGNAWYENDGNPAGLWQEHLIGSPLNNMNYVYDFDNDGDIDVLGTPGTYESVQLLWAQNDGAGNFTIIDNVDDGVSSYIEPFTAGRTLGIFQSGGPMQIAFSWNGGENGSSGIQTLTIPSNPATTTWSMTTIHPNSQGEDIEAGDIDGDGDLDLFQGEQWLRNDDGTWTAFQAFNFIGLQVDRVELADIDGDGDLDAVVGFINGPSPLVWLECPADPTTSWTLHTIADPIAGALSLRVADMNGDGDIDICHGEFYAPGRHFVFENNGNGSSWTTYEIDGGNIDHHDGSVPVDIDNDGDLDLLSPTWNSLKLWLFENLAID